MGSLVPRQLGVGSNMVHVIADPVTFISGTAPDTAHEMPPEVHVEMQLQ